MIGVATSAMDCADTGRIARRGMGGQGSCDRCVVWQVVGSAKAGSVSQHCNCRPLYLHEHSVAGRHHVSVTVQW